MNQKTSVNEKKTYHNFLHVNENLGNTVGVVGD